MADRPILFSSPMVRALLAGTKVQTRRILKPQPETFQSEGAECEVALEHLDGDPWPRVRTGRVITMQEVRYVKDMRLWVRETWQYAPQKYCTCAQGSEPAPCDDWSSGTGCRSNRSGAVLYRADAETLTRQRPSIFMPRWASRLTLTVTDVRVQRLQEISEEDAVQEGCAATIGANWWQGYRDLGRGGHLLHQTAPGDAPPHWMIEPKPAGRSAWQDRSARDAYRELWGEINGAGSWDANPWICAVSFRVHRCNIDSLGSEA